MKDIDCNNGHCTRAAGVCFTGKFLKFVSLIWHFLHSDITFEQNFLKHSTLLLATLGGGRGHGLNGPTLDPPVAITDV